MGVRVAGGKIQVGENSFGMSDPVALLVSAACLLLALANVPLLVLAPRVGEQRVWRRLRVQTVRRWITRRRGAGKRQAPASILIDAKRNIVWHLVLSLLIAVLVLHPAIASLSYRGVVYAFAIAGCMAYVAGSVVQRQKIVIILNGEAGA